MKIELEAGVWLTEGEGDPPRTLDKRRAKDFETLTEAHAALKEARKFRPFKGAIIIDDFI